MDLSSISRDILGCCANTVRVLSAEAVQRANSGHPGMPMGTAEIGLALWLKHISVNPQDPKWINRDRFVLSNGHGSMFLYSFLHLLGFDLSIEDLKNFRQWESKTPGHPESFMTAGVEATTGPLGQGISNAVGMAIGQKVLAEKYNKPDGQIVSHNIYCMVGDGCLMEGISSEASSLAGHLGLGNLNVVFDDNHISIAGNTNLAFTENVGARYKAYGWHVLEVDGHDVLAVDQALSECESVSDRPSLICAKTIIGKGSPNKADTSGVHGSPLGGEELEKTKQELGWNEPEFTVPGEVKEVFAKRQEELKANYQEWSNTFASWKAANGELAGELDKQLSIQVPANFAQSLVKAGPDSSKAAATRKTSAAILQEVAKNIPGLVGGSADLEPSCLTVIKDSSSISKESFAGRNIHFGVREHGMGAIMNGLSYYGGFVPFGSTFLCFADYMRPAIRIAALSKLQALFIFTHDSIFLGEDGPTHQPVEHVNSLRMIPNVQVFRPANTVETAVAYEQALERKDGPSVLVFTRQDVAPIDNADVNLDDVRKGAYTVFQTSESPEYVFVATGSEVPLAIESAKQLNADVRVVSMPCWNAYQAQKESFKESLIPTATKKVVVEAGTSFGWPGMISADAKNTCCISVDEFGASAPDNVLAEKYGFTAKQIVAKIQEFFK